MENLERLLREHEFTKDLSADETAFLVSCVENRRFARGELLLREGAPADKFYLIRQGHVAIEADVPGRGPTVFETIGEGDVLGLSWLVPPHHVEFDARAVEPVVALVFDGACLRGKMESDPRLGFVLSRRLLSEVVKRLQRARIQRLDVYKAG